MIHGSQCWGWNSQTRVNNIIVMKMRISRWMSGNITKKRLGTNEILENIRVALIEEMIETILQ